MRPAGLLGTSVSKNFRKGKEERDKESKEETGKKSSVRPVKPMPSDPDLSSQGILGNAFWIVALKGGLAWG